MDKRPPREKRRQATTEEMDWTIASDGTSSVRIPLGDGWEAIGMIVPDSPDRPMPIIAELRIVHDGAIPRYGLLAKHIKKLNVHRYIDNEDAYWEWRRHYPDQIDREFLHAEAIEVVPLLVDAICDKDMPCP